MHRSEREVREREKSLPCSLSVSLLTSSFSCLCTVGFTGVRCRQLDRCSPNPCENGGICRQVPESEAFQCQCLPNYTGVRCENFLTVCQLNSSLCSSTAICIAMTENGTNVFACVSRDDLQYLVFDYLNDYKDMQVVLDENLPQKLADFLRNLPVPVKNFVLVDRRKLGPYKYDRAELLSLAIPPANGNLSTLANALDGFCVNQSARSTLLRLGEVHVLLLLAEDSFAREICAGHQQTAFLRDYLNNTPSFCPNCSFIAGSDKYYWFDQMLPLLPLWLSLIRESSLSTSFSIHPMLLV